MLENKSVFGQSAFGSTNTNTFGSTFGQNAFGQAATSNTSAFNSKPAGGSLFGGTQTQPTGSLFGSTQNKPLFGGGTFGATPQQPNSLFGNSAGFGSMNSTQSTSGGLFGDTSSMGGIFGAKSTGSSLFGSAQAPFSQNKTSFGTGGFGAATSTNQSGGIFGAGSSNFGMQSKPTSSLFSSPGFGTDMSSGTQVKFVAPTSADSFNKNNPSMQMPVRLQCICAMKEYSSKSMEELRLEDYAAGRKGSQNSTFGSSMGLFGSQPQQTSAFSSGTFGTTTTSSSGMSLFGNTSTPATGLFGQNKSLFGAAATTSAPTGLPAFGTNTGTGLFGQMQPKQPGGLFGSLATSSSSSFGLFGANKPTQAPFSFSTSNTFGQPAQQSSTGLFGSTNTTTTFSGLGTGLFGAKPALSTGGSLFSNPQGTSLFGAQQKPFGAAAPSFGGLGTSNFGSTGGSLFSGTLGSTALGTSQPTLGQIPTANVDDQLMPQLIQAIIRNPYGFNPLFQNLKPSGDKAVDLTAPTNPIAQKKLLMKTSGSSPVRVPPGFSPRARPKPLGYNSAKKSVFDELEDSESQHSQDMKMFTPRRSVKTLVINRDRSLHAGQTGQSGTPTLASASLSIDSRLNRSLPVTVGENEFSAGDAAISRANDAVSVSSSFVLHGAECLSDRDFEGHVSHGAGRLYPSLDSSIDDLKLRGSGKEYVDDTKQRSKIVEANVSLNSSVSPIPLTVSSDETFELDGVAGESQKNTIGVEITRRGYYVEPPLCELCRDSEGRCLVQGFLIGRSGYGSVFFPGTVNIADLNLDEIVHFRRKEITVYPDDEMKPPVGEGLNCPSEVTLDCVWPLDKTDRKPIKDVGRLTAMKYQDKLELATLRMGAEFKDYRPETGSWVFRVKHFSRYGLRDEDEEEDGSVSNKKRSIQSLKNTLGDANVERKPSESSSVCEVVAERKVPLVEPLKETVVLQRSQTLDLFDNHMEACVPMFPEEGKENYDSNMDVMSTYLSRGLGADASRVQVMKAAFFGDEEHMEEESFASPAAEFHTRLTGQSKSGFVCIDSSTKGTKEDDLFFSSLGDTPRRFLRDFPKFDVKMPVESFQNCKIFVPHKPLVISPDFLCPVPLSESFSKKHKHLLSDTSLVQGRRWRMGWGPSWTLFHNGIVTQLQRKVTTLFSPDAKRCRPMGILYPVTAYSLNTALDSTFEKDLVVSLLKIQWDCSFINESDVSSSPVGGSLVFNKMAEKLHQLQISPDSSRMSLTHQERCLSLGSALFGPLLDGECLSDVYLLEQQRKTSLSRWLRRTIRDQLNSEIGAPDSKSSLKTLFLMLTAGDLDGARVQALRSGNPFLSVLMMADGANRRHYLLQQLETWKKLKADIHIPYDILRIYCLLSGQFVWTLSGRLAKDFAYQEEQPNDINLYMGMDWIRAFAIGLWYAIPPEASIGDALKLFDDSVTSNNCASPYPLYVTTSPNYDRDIYLSLFTNSAPPLAVEYHLLSLYGRGDTSIKHMVDPSSHTARPLDYGLSWFLIEALRGGACGERLLFDDALSVQLTVFFSAQLEASGLWLWSVYVLMHLPHTASRYQQIQSIINRHYVAKLNEPDEYDQRLPSPDFVPQDDPRLFLKGQLKIPSVWLDEAVRLRSCYL